MSQKALDAFDQAMRDYRLTHGSNLMLMSFLIIQLDLGKAWMDSETKDGSDSPLRQECMKRIEKETKEKGHI